MKKNSPIIGSLLYSYQATRGTTLLILAALVLCGFAMLLTGSTSIFSNLYGFGIVGLSCAFMLCAGKDNTAGWNKFQLAMPMTRSNVITAKYLGSLLLMLTAITLIVIFSGVSSFLYENIREIFLSTYSLGIILTAIAISLTACALFYPIIYTLGENKEEILTIFCIAGGGALHLFIALTGEKMGYTFLSVAVVCISVSVILFAASYLIAKKIYAEKDL